MDENDPHTKTLEYRVSVIESLETVNADDWNDCAGTNPFCRYEFLKALEDSKSVGPVDTGWIPRYFIITDQSDKLIAAMPCYLKTHSQGEYVFDHNWAEAYMRAGSQYYPKLQCSIPFTPATGPRLLVSKGFNDTHQMQLKQALLNASKKFTEDNSLSSFHLTFLTDDDIKACEENSLLLRSDQQFHWFNHDFKSFDDFLDTLSSRKRKQIRKERRTAQGTGLQIEQLSGHDLTESHWDFFFACYHDTGNRKWGRPYLTRAFFSMVGASMPDQILMIFVNDENGKPVAAALNFVGETAIYGRHWGALEHYDCLHFEACYYQAIDYAIENGLDRVEAGAQGPHKVARGYEPVKTTSAHYLPNESFSEAVERFLEVEGDHIDAEIAYFADHLPFKSYE